MKSGQLKKIWKARDQIFEGVVNSIFIDQEIEKVASWREAICKTNQCGSYDTIGDGCDLKGSQPCCSNLTGGCGCVIALKIRSLSSACPKGYWPAELTPEEEDSLPI